MKFNVTVHQELDHDFIVEADNIYKARELALAVVDNWITNSVRDLPEKHEVHEPYVACTDITEITDKVHS